MDIRMFFLQIKDHLRKVVRMPVACKHIERLFLRKLRQFSLKIIKQQIRRFRLHKKCAVMNVCDLHVLKPLSALRAIVKIFFRLIATV